MSKIALSALGLFLVLVLGAPRLFDPPTRMLLHAVRSLGPIGGWRCARTPTYIYDPSREQADGSLLAETPESVVLTQATDDLVIDRVQVNLREAEAVVWTHVATVDPSGEVRVYVLAPGALQTITFDDFGAELIVCNAHLGDWKITAEHELG